MARVATPLGNLGTWLDNENPGAGSQTVDNNGLNGNAIKLDTGVFTEHNTNGTHKSNIIDKGNLKTTVCDGSTIEKDATVGLRIKDLGVTSAKIAANAVIAGKLADGAVETAARIVDAIITGAKLVAATITGAKIASHTVAASNLTQDNNARKLHYIFSGTYTFGAGEANNPLLVMRAGYITKIGCVKLDDSSTSQATIAYGTSGYHLTANVPLVLNANATTVGKIDIYHNAALVHQLSVTNTTGQYRLIIEVENDD